MKSLLLVMNICLIALFQSNLAFSMSDPRLKICYTDSKISEETAKELARNLEGLAPTTLATCSTQNSGILSKKFPGSKKNVGALLSSLPLSLTTFTVTHLSNLKTAPFRFFESLVLKEFIARGYAHSDYKIIDWVEKRFPNLNSSFAYTVFSLAFWTIAPSIFLYPMYPGSIALNATVSFLVNTIFLASVNKSINAMYDIRGLDEIADRYQISWYVGSNVFITVYQKIMMILGKGIGKSYTFSGLYAGIIAIQIIAALLIERYYNKHLNPKRFVLSNANIEEINNFVSESLELKKPFNRRYKDDVWLKLEFAQAL